MGCSKKKLQVCMGGKACPKMGSDDIFASLKKAIRKSGLNDYLKLKKVDCLDYCKYAPVVKVDGIIYGRLKENDVIEIALHHTKKKKPIKDLMVARKKKR